MSKVITSKIHQKRKMNNQVNFPIHLVVLQINLKINRLEIRTK